MNKKDSHDQFREWKSLQQKQPRWRWRWTSILSLC